MIQRACGVDVHKDGFVATILTSRGCEAHNFEKTVEDIEAFKAWLKTNKCRAVAMESTGGLLDSTRNREPSTSHIITSRSLPPLNPMA
jgi:hypothetical protein